MASIEQMLAQTEHLSASPMLDDSIETAHRALEQAFGGLQPDMVVADLTDSPDLLPLQHLQRIFRSADPEHGETPPTLALLSPRHLHIRGWNTLLDDFMLPPYQVHEVVPRLLLMARRKKLAYGTCKKIADITMDTSSAQVLAATGEPLPLTPKEYALFQFLATHRGRTFSRSRLLGMVWGLDYEGGERTVDIHITRLRAKLGGNAAALLETRRGTGYCLRDE